VDRPLIPCGTYGQGRDNEKHVTPTLTTLINNLTTIALVDLFLSGLAYGSIIIK